MTSWLELLRISNGPTVVSNVLAGISLGLLARMNDTPLPWTTLLLVVGGTLLVYWSGMILNDVFDAKVDATERPTRPIPSGRIPRTSAQIAGLAMLAGGTVMLCLAGPDTTPWALLLAATVLLYDVAHRQMPCAWLLLGVCRGTAIVIAARAVSVGAEWGMVLWVAGGLTAYVSCLSIAAKDEMRTLPEAARVAAGVVVVLTLCPLGLLMFDMPMESKLGAVLAAAVLVFLALPSAWFASRHALAGKSSVPIAVGSWIGAIPLMDAAVCFLTARPWMGLACIGLWGLAGALRPKIAAS